MNAATKGGDFFKVVVVVGAVELRSLYYKTKASIAEIENR